MNIPFNKPYVSNSAASLARQVLDSGHLSGNGVYSQKCCQWLERESGCQRAFLTPSCTAALEMSALLCEITPGQEVLLPAFTFVSTANAFVMMGARPIFVDVCPDTLNLSPESLAKKITPQSRVIVPVHYAGVACEMTAITALAEEHHLTVVEDNAHGLAGTFDKKPLGSLGDLATLSFHETKNFCCGEGGALLVNREDWVERAQILQDKGTNRSKFMLGQVDKYTWVDKGSSYLLGELPASLLLSCLHERQSIQKRRHEIWQRYSLELTSWCSQNGILRQDIPAYAGHTAHLFYLQMPEQRYQLKFIQHLRERGITATFHYQALNECPMGIQLGGIAGSCPVAERAARTIVRLPLYAQMTDLEQDYILDAITGFHFD
ncbi:dTDP-4-amino-4,6-dideoxygalactose transaminase [bacterium]|nr:dTDP-4-amino-4,6-dideoxygalactose transaminase [bacterium]